MGNLTDDMTRLRGEVEALRGVREALIQDLTRGAMNLAATVSAMRADFSAAHAAMAKQTRGEREAFIAAMTSEVNALLGAFSRDRDVTARQGKHDRGAFLAEMKTLVMGLRQETADDLLGARLAWGGRSPAKSHPAPLKKGPVIVKPIASPGKATLEKTVAKPVMKAEKPPIVLKNLPKKEEVKKTVTVPLINTAKSPVALKDPLEKEGEKRTVAVPEFKVEKVEKPPVTLMEPLKKEKEEKTVFAPAVPEVKTPSPVSSSVPLSQKSKEKGLLDEKPAKAMIRAKRVRK